MPIKSENEKLIREFLLDELPEQQRFEFEERFITDASLFEQIKIVEDGLIEKYIRGWMNSAERLKFEKNFLTTEKRRGRVEFSRQFINEIQNISAGNVIVKTTDEAVSNESVWQKFAGIFLTPKIAAAAAFAVLIAIFGSWFLYQKSNSEKTEIAQKKTTETPTPIQTPTPEVSVIETPNEPEDNQNETVENETDADNSLIKEIPQQSPKVTEQIIQKNTTPKPTPEIKTSPPNPVLALFAGTMRSEGKNNVLNLPENAKSATLQLNLETVDYKVYQSNLTDADGNVIFRRDNLKAKKSKINLFIPAENLLKGDYIIKLFGKNDAGENESVADFQFRIN